MIQIVTTIITIIPVSEEELTLAVPLSVDPDELDDDDDDPDTKS